MTWGFVLAEITTYSILRIKEKGEWTELAKMKIGSEPSEETAGGRYPSTEIAAYTDQERRTFAKGLRA